MSPCPHTCGYPILRVVPCPNKCPELVLWYDGKRDSATYREEILHCPQCGEKLLVQQAGRTSGQSPQSHAERGTRQEPGNEIR